MPRQPGDYDVSDDEGDGDAPKQPQAGVAAYPAMAEADMHAAVDMASNGGGGEVVLTDRGLKGRQVLSLREPLASWSAASVVHLDLSRNRLRDKGAAAVVKVLAGNSSIKRLQLEHNGIGDPGAAALGDLLRKHGSITDVNLRKNAFTDTGARAVVVALHENHAIQLLDITKNKTVSYSMHEAGRLAAETNLTRHKGMLALDTLATLYETVEVIKGELGLMASMPIVQALDQACALLGVAQPEPAAAEADGGDAKATLSPLHAGEEKEAAPAPAPAQSKMLLTERAEAVVNELGMPVTPVKAQASRDRVLRSLALGYAAQPADVAHLDGIARGAGVNIKEILGFARAQLEAEKSLATADVNPIMEDDRTRRRRYKREQDEAAKPVRQPTVLEQLAELLDQAVEKNLLTEGARKKIQEKVHNGQLNPTTCMVQWSQKLQVADEFEGLWDEASTAAPGEAPPAPPPQTAAPERQPDWKQVVDEQSGKSYYYNRRTRETTWSTPPGGFVQPTEQRDALFDSDDDAMPGFEEWALPTNKPPPSRAAPPPAAAPVRPAAAAAQRPDELFGFAPQAAAAPSPAPAGERDDMVVEFGGSEMGQLAWRETAQGTVQLVRAPARVAELGLQIGMLLDSVGIAGDGAGRTPVGMLSYAGAVDQIDSTAAKGRGVSLGFLRAPATARQPGQYDDSSDSNSDSDDNTEGMFAADAGGGGGGTGFAAAIGVDAAGFDAEFGPGVSYEAPRQPARAAAVQSTSVFGTALPQQGDRFVVVFSDGAVVRSGCEMHTPLVGKVPQGQVLRATAAQSNSNGLLRLCIGEPRGWVSVRASDGTPLLREAPVGLSQEVTSMPGAANIQGAPVGDADFFGDLDRDVLFAPPPPPKSLGEYTVNTHHSLSSRDDSEGWLVLVAEKSAAMVERALEHDQAEEFAEAVSCYQKAAVQLHSAAKESKASLTQASYYRSKATEYLVRAEELSDLLAEQRRRDAERQKLLDTTSQQLALAEDPLRSTSSGNGPVSSKEEKRRAKKNAKAVRNLRRNPSGATVEEVVAWLASIECAGCAAAFAQHEVDGEALLELTETQLRDDLGLTRMGDRARIRRERDRLVEGDAEGGRGGAPPPPPAPPEEDYDALFGDSGAGKSGSRKGGKSPSSAAKEARKAKTGRRGTAPPPPPPVAAARVKVSARWGNGGDWVHVKMDGEEAVVLSAVKQRLATTMQMSPMAFSYMQYQDAQGDWCANTPSSRSLIARVASCSCLRCSLPSSLLDLCAFCNACVLGARFAVLRDEDLLEAVAEHEGKKLVLQALQQRG